MDVNKLSSLANRAFFVAAFVLFGLAVLDKVLHWFGLSLLGQLYSPARLLEFAVICLIFVIALLLRQIREVLGGRGAAQ